MAGLQDSRSYQGASCLVQMDLLGYYSKCGGKSEQNLSKSWQLLEASVDSLTQNNHQTLVGGKHSVPFFLKATVAGLRVKLMEINSNWFSRLVVSTRLKNMSQIGSSRQGSGLKINKHLKSPPKKTMENPLHRWHVFMKSYPCQDVCQDFRIRLLQLFGLIDPYTLRIQTPP